MGSYPGNILNSVTIIFFNCLDVKNKKENRGKVDFKYFGLKCVRTELSLACETVGCGL